MSAQPISNLVWVTRALLKIAGILKQDAPLGSGDFFTTVYGPDALDEDNELKAVLKAFDPGLHPRDVGGEGSSGEFIVSGNVPSPEQRTKVQDALKQRGMKSPVEIGRGKYWIDQDGNAVGGGISHSASARAAMKAAGIQTMEGSSYYSSSYYREMGDFGYIRLDAAGEGNFNIQIMGDVSNLTGHQRAALQTLHDRSLGPEDGWFQIEWGDEIDDPVNSASGDEARRVLGLEKSSEKSSKKSLVHVPMEALQ